MKEIIFTENAPKPVGPYNQAIKTGNLVFLAGQIPLNTDGQMVEGGVVEQTKQIFENIKTVLTEAGTSLENVVKATVFLKDLNDFAAMNEVYAANFDEKTAPARSTIQVVKLPLDALVEIEVIAQCHGE